MIPWLLGSDYVDLQPELRKALEITLHAGATAALLIAWRQALRDDLAALDGHQLRVLALATAPAALAGFLLADPIEFHLGRPPAIAGGLLAGALAMVLGDRRPERRRAREATVSDALWLGLAQASALVPGVSRSGATLAAARLRRFKRAEAQVLSRRLAFPVTSGATLLGVHRLSRGRLDASARVPLAAAVVASFGSTLLCARLAPAAGARRLWPYALYRIALAGAIVTRIRPS